MMSEMYDLIYNGKEGDFPEPADLPDEAAKGTKLEKYRIQLKMALDKQEKYNANKAQLFRLIAEQCVPMMRSKLEHKPTYNTVETSKDVVELMKLMKKLVYSTNSNQYEFWTMQASLTTLLTQTQHGKEGLA
jgi:spore coat polysaccharide biosynthesis predicted glycosyltransferase SpsG